MFDIQGSMFSDDIADMNFTWNVLIWLFCFDIREKNITVWKLYPAENKALSLASKLVSQGKQARRSDQQNMFFSFNNM